MHISQDFEILEDFLGTYFVDRYYDEAVQKVRHLLKTKDYNWERWNEAKRIITNRSLNDGEALRAIHEGANLPLNENTDEEAYIWLDLMVKNVERQDGKIEEYE